jgi:hypothetical protein
LLIRVANKIIPDIEAVNSQLHLANSRKYNELWENEIADRGGIEKITKKVIIEIWENLKDDFLNLLDKK